MRIAVSTDFSEQAERARLVAMALARKIGASVTLIHAVEPPVPGADSDQMRAEAQRRLSILAQPTGKQDPRVELELIQGYAEEVIATAADRIGARLLVIGTHGRRAPLRWLLGSVAERTLQSSEVPVLVVGQAADPSWRGLTGRSRCVSPLRWSRPSRLSPSSTWCGYSIALETVS
jgi:nucleotide-binding universal stress UspA family protein